MDNKYDYSMKMKVEEVGSEADGKENQENFDPLYLKMKKREKEIFIYQDILAQKHFDRMEHLMRKFANEQSALLEIKKNKREGQFIMRMPLLCFMGDFITDRRIIKYMERNTTFFYADIECVVMDISVMFQKRKEKPVVFLKKLIGIDHSGI